MTNSNVITLGANAPAILKLTKTMLDKHIIDANASVRAFARLLGIDYSNMAKGQKVTVDAEFLDAGRTTLSFYRTANRGDRRFSIKGVKSFASVGDTLAITFRVTDSGDVVLVINVTERAEFAPVLLEGAQA